MFCGRDLRLRDGGLRDPHLLDLRALFAKPLALGLGCLCRPSGVDSDNFVRLVSRMNKHARVDAGFEQGNAPERIACARVEASDAAIA